VDVEIEAVLARVLGASPLAAFLDTSGLARTVAASFVGLELYEGVDEDGAGRALATLEQLGPLAAVLDDQAPVIRRALRAALRRTTRCRSGDDAQPLG
jgi:hypothetical protein